MNKKEALGLAALVFIGVLALLLMGGYMAKHDKELIEKTSVLLTEYNTGLTPVYCVDTINGYLCDVDTKINLSDRNVSFDVYARGRVLITQEDNKLFIYKLEPAPKDHDTLVEMNIPDVVRDALSKFTLVIGDKMYCTLTVDSEVKGTSSNHYKCYIPTNTAPIGNAQIFYAPLFQIDIDNGEVVRVIVNV